MIQEYTTKEKVLSRLDRRKLTKLGKKVMLAFDEGTEDTFIADRVRTITNVINNCEREGIEWGLATDRGLPYVYPIL